MRRVVLVGATDGIGRALAEVYAGQGFWVTIVGRNPGKLEAVARDLRGRFPVATVHTVLCDLTDPTRIEPAFHEAVEKSGHVDLAIYVAGVLFEGDGFTNDLRADTETLVVNTVAAVQWLGLFGNHFRVARRGHIAGISSIAGDRGRRGNPAYTASKAGLTTYLEALRNRLFRFGVRVSTVKPGYVGTKLVSGKKGMFWVCPPDVAARTIAERLEKGHEVFYVYRRWAALAAVLKVVPRFVFKRFGPP